MPELRRVGTKLCVVPGEGNPRDMDSGINIGMPLPRDPCYQSNAVTDRTHFKNIIPPIIEMLKTTDEQSIRSKISSEQHSIPLYIVDDMHIAAITQFYSKPDKI